MLVHLPVRPSHTVLPPVALERCQSSKGPSDACCGVPSAKPSFTGTLVRQHNPYSSAPEDTMVVVVPAEGVQHSLRRVFYQYESPAWLEFVHCGGPHLEQPHVKLGGICGDMSAAVIANLICALSGVRVRGVEMFSRSLGRCCLWLHDPSTEGPRIIAAMHELLWMSDAADGFAIVVQWGASRNFLEGTLEALRARGGPARFPRHLLTAEEWIPDVRMPRAHGSKCCDRRH